MPRLALVVGSMGFVLLSGCMAEPAAPGEALDVAFSHNGTPGHSGGVFHADLDPAEEVATVVSNAQGSALFRLSPRGEWIDYQLKVQRIDNILQAHIHLAPRGVNGGIVVWLYPDGPPATLIPGRTNGMLATGRITASQLVGTLAGMELEDLLGNLRSGNAYVNVHTSQYPPGEMRGQVEQHGNH